MSTPPARTKCHPSPPPPPSPKALHFPLSRRTRRKLPTSPAVRSHRRNPAPLHFSTRGNQENPFVRENDERLAARRKERVGGEREGSIGEPDEQKLEKNRVKMEMTLRSSLHTLVSGKRLISEGKNLNSVLEKEMEYLSEKLEELHKSSITDYEFRKKCREFDRKTCVLQRRLENLGGELSDESNCSNEFRNESSLCNDTSHDVDEQSRVLNSETDNTSTGEHILREDKTSSGRCKAIIRGIVEQVKAETEQWSQMQEMLERVRVEMEELKASRDYWENRAKSSDHKTRSLKHALEEWREKAHRYKINANELQLEISALQKDLRKFKAESNLQRKREIKLISNPPRKQLEKQKLVMSHHTKENRHSYEELSSEENKARVLVKDLSSISLGKQLVNKRRMNFRRLKEKRCASEKGYVLEEEVSFNRRRKLHLNRSPLEDIGNLSSLARENGEVTEQERERFRK